MAETSTLRKDPRQGAAGQAQDKAKEVAPQAQDRAREAAGRGARRLRDQVDTRSTDLGERVGSAPRGSLGGGRAPQAGEGHAGLGYVEQAADRAERLGGYLQQSDGDTILRDVEDFRAAQSAGAGGRRLLLGFAASRMLKASSGERYRVGQSVSGTPSQRAWNIERTGDGGPRLRPESVQAAEMASTNRAS